MDMLESLKGVFGKLTGKGTSSEEATSKSAPDQGPARTGTESDITSAEPINPNELRQVSYFKVHAKDNRFLRNYAPLVKVTDHELYIYLNGEVRVIPSQYFIPEHLEQADTGDIVFMFVHEQELYPLPRDRAYFDKNYDLQVRYRETNQNPAALAANDPTVQAVTVALNKAKDMFLQARDAVRNFATAQVNFVKNLPPLAPATGSPARVESKAAKPSRPEPIPILPATEPRAGVLAVKKVPRSKRKEFAAAVDHLLRPD